MAGLPFDISLFYTRDPIPSLEKLAAMKLVENLWKTVDIIKATQDNSWLLCKGYTGWNVKNNFRNLERIVADKIRNILWDDCMVFTADRFRRRIGLQICDWIDHNKLNLQYLTSETFFDSVVWTYNGILDRRGSMDLLIRNTNITMLFRSACEFCIEYQIRHLWKIMPEQEKLIYINSHKKEFLLLYWVHTMRKTLEDFVVILRVYASEFFSDIIEDEFFLHVNGEDIQFENIDGYMMLFSAEVPNPTAVEYFFSKIHFSERSVWAFNCMHVAMQHKRFFPKYIRHDYADIVFFTYTHLHIDDKISFVCNFYTDYLHYMLIYCSYTHRLVPTVSLIGELLTLQDYFSLFYKVSNHILLQTHVEKSLLKQIWDASPEHIKTMFFRYICCSDKMMNLFSKETFLTRKSILDHVSETESNSLYSFFEI